MRVIGYPKQVGIQVVNSRNLVLCLCGFIQLSCGKKEDIAWPTVEGVSQATEQNYQLGVKIMESRPGAGIGSFDGGKMYYTNDGTDPTKDSTSLDIDLTTLASISGGATYYATPAINITNSVTFKYFAVVSLSEQQKQGGLINQKKKVSKEMTSETITVAVKGMLEGSWKSGCIQFASDIYVVLGGVITGNQQTTSTTAYLTSACASPLFVDEETYTFVIGDKLANLDNTYKKDVSVVSLTRKLLTDDYVKQANADSWYGYTDWVINTPKDTVGKKVSSDGSAEDSVGEKFYTIVQVKDNKWYSGDTATGDTTTEATRPTSISTTVFLEKM